MRGHTFWLAGVVAAGLTASGCGGSSPTAPSGGGGGGTPVATTTITISGGAVSPKTISVVVGSRVTFVNSDNRSHDMNSDPHPEHTSCPAINVGFLAAGQSRTSENLTTVRTCSYHDHDQPDNANLKGTIVIVAAG